MKNYSLLPLSLMEQISGKDCQSSFLCCIESQCYCLAEHSGVAYTLLWDEPTQGDRKENDGLAILQLQRNLQKSSSDQIQKAFSLISVTNYA